jgi:Smg protein
MKENVFDVLIYLFENYMDSDVDQAPDPDLIRTELLEAGFPQPEINKAFEWLESLTEQQAIKAVSSPAFRIFSAREMAKLDAECRGLLLFLEQSGILTPTSRELVIDRVMAFNEETISLENLKWVVLMVLFSQPNEEIAFARMENLVYESLPTTYLH